MITLISHVRKDWLFWPSSTPLWRVTLLNTTTSQADPSFPAKTEIHKGESEFCLRESGYRAITFHFLWSQVALSFTSAGTTKNLCQLGIHAVENTAINTYIHIYILLHTHRETPTYMHGKLQFHALLPFIHNTWRHTLWQRHSFHGMCYWSAVLQHLLAAEAWGSQGHSVPFKVLNRLVPKNKSLTPSNFSLYSIYSCLLSPSPGFIILSSWSTLFAFPHLNLPFSGLLHMLHAQDPCWLLLQHPVPCTPVQGVPSAFKAVDKPMCAWTLGTECTESMHCYQLHAPARGTCRLFVPHYCRSFSDWHPNEHWPC